MTAGMQHLYDISNPPVVGEETSLYLRAAIQALHGMKTALPVTRQYLQVLADLAKGRLPNTPANVLQAFLMAGVHPGSPPHIPGQLGTSNVLAPTSQLPPMQTLGLSKTTQRSQIFNQSTALSPSMPPKVPAATSTDMATDINDMLSAAGSPWNGNLAQLHQGVLALGEAGSGVNVDIDLETWRARLPGL